MADKKKGGAKPAPAAAAAAPAPRVTQAPSSKAPANKPTAAAASSSSSSSSGESKSAGKRKPDEAKYEKDMSAIDTKIAELQAKIESLRSRIDNVDSSSPGGANRKALLDDRKKISDEFRVLREQKDRLLKQYEDLKKVRDAKVKEAEDIRDKAGPHKTADKIDQTIADMEAKIRGGNLKLIDEKKYVTEISNLKKGKKNLEAYEKKMEELDGEKKAVDELKDKLDGKSEELRKVSEAITKIDGQLDELKKGQDEDKAKISSLIMERNVAKQQMEELYEKKRSVYATFKVQRDEYRTFIQEEQVKKKEAQRVLREQILEEKKKALEERRKEERLLPKFVEEISTAASIISFLKNFYLAEKPQEVSQDKKAVGGMEGMVALKSTAERNAEDIYFVGKPAEKKKAPAPKVTKKTESIRLSIAMLDQFSMLGVVIPSTVGDVEETVKALQAKKEFYEEKQKKELEKAQKEVEEELKNMSVEKANDSAGDNTTTSEDKASPAAAEAPANEREIAGGVHEETKADDLEEGEIVN